MNIMKIRALNIKKVSLFIKNVNSVADCNALHDIPCRPLKKIVKDFSEKTKKHEIVIIINLSKQSLY